MRTSLGQSFICGVGLLDLNCWCDGFRQCISVSDEDCGKYTLIRPATGCVLRKNVSRVKCIHMQWELLKGTK